MDKIYTIQPKSVYSTLLSNGVFNAKRSLCDNLNDMQDTTDQWGYAYAWMREQLVKKTGVNPPQEVYPIWGWVSTEENPMPLDLRLSFYKNWSSTKEELFLLELNLPSTEHLPSEFSAWHYALNGWYLAQEQEADLFEKDCNQKGLQLYRGMISHLPEEVQCKIADSWLACFDQTKLDAIGDMRPYSWQTVFWDLRLKNIVSARKFVTKGKNHERN